MNNLAKDHSFQKFETIIPGSGKVIGSLQKKMDDILHQENMKTNEKLQALNKIASEFESVLKSNTESLRSLSKGMTEKMTECSKQMEALENEYKAAKEEEGNLRQQFFKSSNPKVSTELKKQIETLQEKSSEIFNVRIPELQEMYQGYRNKSDDFALLKEGLKSRAININVMVRESESFLKEYQALLDTKTQPVLYSQADKKHSQSEVPKEPSPGPKAGSTHINRKI